MHMSKHLPEQISSYSNLKCRSSVYFKNYFYVMGHTSRLVDLLDKFDRKIPKPGKSLNVLALDTNLARYNNSHRLLTKTCGA